MAALDFPNAPTVGATYTAPNGAVYTWDGAAWTVSGVLSTGTAAGGDLTGTYPNPTIAAGAVTDPKITSVAYAKVTGHPTSYPPSGAAGGSLGGSYPNPGLAVKASVQTWQGGNVPASFSTATVGAFVNVVTTSSITTRGGLVLILGWISGVISSSTAGGAIYFEIARSGTTVSLWKYELVAAATNIRFPLGNIAAFDVPGPAAGTYTYSFAVQQLASGPTFLTGGDNPGSLWAVELS